MLFVNALGGEFSGASFTRELFSGAPLGRFCLRASLYLRFIFEISAKLLIQLERKKNLPFCEIKIPRR